MKNYVVLLSVLVLTTSIFIGWKQVESASQPETMELVPMMRLLLADMYTIEEGVYTENFQMIEEGGNSIADHPVMTEEDKVLIKKTLGEQFKKFVSYDMIVHHHADSVALAATQKNMREILRHYQIVQKGCVNCHSDFRAKIVNARE